MLAAAILWGTTGTIAHQAPPGSTPALVGLATFGFGGLLLLALNPKRAARLLRDRSTWPVLVVSALGVILYASCYYWSMALVGVAIGNAVALGTGPIFAAALEAIIARSRVRSLWLLSTSISLIGISLLAGSANPASGPHPAAGLLLAVLAGFGYAIYSWGGAQLISRGHRSNPVMATIFALAAALLIPAFIGIGPGPLLSGRGLAVLAYLAAIPLAGAYILFGYALRHIPASTATGIALAEPVVATALATLVLHEHLTTYGWIGLALIFVGVAFTTLSPPSRGS